LIAIRVESADAPPIPPLGLSPKLISLREQASGIERHDFDRERPV